jgi:N-acetylmuramoyl-L-alanine amidase
VSNYRFFTLAIAAPACLLLAGNAVSQTETPAPALSAETSTSLKSPNEISIGQSPVAATDLQVAPPSPPEQSVDPREAECIAKVIVHEAANQPYKGMVAVAQVITNRMKHPHFPKTACAVVNQPRQFFRVDAYNPSRTTQVWKTAMEIAHDALQDRAEPVVPGALFFNMAGGGMPGRVATSRIGDHVFYR